MSEFENKIKADLANVNNRFQNECGNVFAGATKKQAKVVLAPFGSDAEIDAFFDKLAINELLHYKEVLVNKYG